MGDAPGEEAEGEGGADDGAEEAGRGGEVRVDAPVEGYDAGHRIGSDQAAAHVCAPISPSATGRRFSAWNWRATFAVVGP